MNRKKICAIRALCSFVWRLKPAPGKDSVTSRKTERLVNMQEGYTATGLTKQEISSKSKISTSPS